MARVDRTAQGLAPVDQRFTESAINQTESTYTQAGSRPGVAVATNSKQNAAPILSGAQDTAIDLKVSKSGDPSVERRGSAYLWRKDSEANEQYRGWTSPVWWTRTSSVHFSGVAAITTLDACVDHDSQGVSVIFAEGTTTPLSWRRLTESDQSLTAAAEVLAVGGGAGSMNGPASIVSLPDGRRIVLDFAGPANLQGPTVYSQETALGSWTELSDDPFPGGTSFVVGAVVALWLRYARGQIICLITDNNGNLHQLASADLGASFRFVETVTGTSGEQGAGVDVYPDGTILIAYHDAAADKLRTKRLGSAFEPISQAAGVDLPTAADVTQQEVPLSVSVDADGTAYVLAYDTTNLGAPRTFLHIYESTDGGLSWALYDSGCFGSNELGSFDMIRSVCAFGRLYVLCALDAVTGASLFWCSGFSNVTPGKTHTNPARTGFASMNQSTSGYHGNWWSCALPSAGTTGYSPFGSGSHALVGSSDDQYLQITTASNTEGFLASQTTATAGAAAAVCWSMRVVSGGGVSSNAIALTLRHSDSAGNQIALSVRFAAAGSVRLTDGTSSSDASITTTERRDYLLELAASTARLYSRAHPGEVWALNCSIVGVATGAASTLARTSWGHLANNSAVSHWWNVAHRHETAELLRSFGTGISAQVGKRIAGSAYPLPGVGSASLASFLRVVGGHNRPIGTPDFNLDPSYDYPVGALFPDQSPSPSAKWRSTGTAAAVDFVIELASGIDTRLDDVLPVVVVRAANFRTLEIATGTAAGVFTTQATLDLSADLPTVPYTRSGDTITISGSPSAGVFRWLHADELIGGSIDFGSGVVKTILSHTAGYPDSAASVVPVFRVDDSGSVPASGSATLIHHSGVCVLSQYAPAPARFWRFRIPVQDTSSGVFEAGTLAIGAAVVPGKRWAEGFTMASEPIVAASDSQSGTRRLEERGEPRRRLTFSWSHGVKLDRLRSAPLTADTISAAAGLPVLAGRGDVLWQLEALQSRSKSGQIPIVAVPAIPATTSTITDPSLYLFGLMEGAIQAAHVLGDEGTDEYLRIESVTLTELV
tara:strand:+ start:2018 stop:5179 length:3162 start_codon:yes stop_codon:yes gene_type:complete